MRRVLPLPRQPVERGRGPLRIRIRRDHRARRALPPALVLIIGFAALIAIGTVILALPISSASGSWTEPMVALFTATSAVCVTGLVVVDTGTHWSSFGQAAILMLVQLGGLGFMTSSTLLLLVLVRRRSSLRDRLVIQQSLGAPQLGDIVALTRRVALFALVAEAAGCVLLLAAFLARGIPLDQSAWWAVFHGISAFNNAGFDLTGDYRGLTAFAGDWAILGVIGTLIVVGGLGYGVVADVWARRRWARLALETKIVLLTSVVLLAVGALLVAAIEWNNPRTLAGLPEGDRVANALFASISTRSGGQNAIPMNGLREPSLVLMMALMFIGAASGSTGGGIRVNTFAVLGVAILATLRGRPSAEIFGRRIVHETVYRALSVALLAIAGAFAAAFTLELTTGLSFLPVAFEAVSAFGTVGLSTGITPELGEASRLLLIVTMFVGRLGPLTVVLALAARRQPVPYRPAVEAVRIG